MSERVRASRGIKREIKREIRTGTASKKRGTMRKKRKEDNKAS